MGNFKWHAVVLWENFRVCVVILCSAETARLYGENFCRRQKFVRDVTASFVLISGYVWSRRRYSAESVPRLAAYVPDDILTDRRVSTVTGDNRWSPTLSIPNYLSQSTFQRVCPPAGPPARLHLKRRPATLSRRRRPDVRGACVSPEGGTEAAECVAGARRPHHSPLGGRNLLF